MTRRLITEDHASVLVGAHVSTMTLSAQLEAERAEVPIITTSYADSIVAKGYKYTFKILTAVEHPVSGRIGRHSRAVPHTEE